MKNVSTISATAYALVDCSDYKFAQRSIYYSLQKVDKSCRFVKKLVTARTYLWLFRKEEWRKNAMLTGLSKETGKSHEHRGVLSFFQLRKLVLIFRGIYRSSRFSFTMKSDWRSVSKIYHKHKIYALIKKKTTIERKFENRT